MNPEWIPYISLGLRYAATLGNVGNRWVFTLKGLRQRVSRHNPFRVAGGCGVSSPGVAAYRNPGLGYAALSGQLIGLLYHARCQVGFYISRSQVVEAVSKLPDKMSTVLLFGAVACLDSPPRCFRLLSKPSFGA